MSHGTAGTLGTHVPHHFTAGLAAMLAALAVVIGIMVGIMVIADAPATRTDTNGVTADRITDALQVKHADDAGVRSVVTAPDGEDALRSKHADDWAP